MKNKLLYRIARIGIFTSIALVMHYLESLLPPILVFAPGAKMGLANVVTLTALILLGYVDTFVIVVVRCGLSALYSSNPFSVVYSLGGGLAAYAVMALLYKFASPKISITAISLSGAVTHNVVQTLIASAIVEQINLILMIPLMLSASLIAGLFIGLVAHYIIKCLPLSLFTKFNTANASGSSTYEDSIFNDHSKQN